MTAISTLRALLRQGVQSVHVFVRDVGAGLLEVSHNSLALLGLCVVAAAVFAGGRADVRDTIEQHALGWLQARQEAREPAPLMAELAQPDAVTRATAVDLSALPRQQTAVVKWLSKRYRVAPEPVGALVQEAWQVGQRVGIDPTLILAVMAIESSFNPFAQSPVGAQGLMQVMTHIHDDKYVAFGGTRAAFDPVTNLRVGVQVLKECIARAGGLEAGLRHYVGAANLGEDGGYVVKVLAEQLNLRRVADGKAVAINAPLPSAVPATVPVILPAAANPAEPASSQPGAERIALLR
ncbi:lytic transglycosylase domain-containing protein [Aquabacterium sp.]|uniref:lytic transglycosylase domain-containing protein n=1 Tax=Aquabacterium sp. TaxID=1872578 RepID=UPI002B870E04|nr:lytic transglycosylase domain-containing protein [Aquabacterium sp.]HSW07913.1 lytic transglycosylase domain-containing protein [Aquabacterium sp.]